MEYKLIEREGKRYIETDDNGNPVVIGDDEKPFGLDAIHLLKKVPVLQAEAKKYREAKEKAEDDLKKFADLNPDAARAAVDKLKNIDLSKMVEAGKLEEVKAEITKSFQNRLQSTEEAYKQKMADLEKSAGQKESDIRRLAIGGRFSASQFVREKTTFPTPAAAEAMFGKHFEVLRTDSGELIPIAKANGNEILSKTQPSNYAGFDEALQILIESHPDRDLYLKPSQKAGSGVTVRNMKGNTEDLMKLSPSELLKRHYANQN